MKKRHFLVIFLIAISLVIGGCSTYKKTDTTECDNQSGSYTRLICYRELALATQDAKVCDKITDGLIRDGCYRDVEKSKRVERIDREITPIRSDIITDDTTTIKVTKASIDEINKCNEIADSYKQIFCFRELAKSTLDIDVCDKIIDLPNTEAHRAGCYFDVATATQDFGICDRMEDNGISEVGSIETKWIKKSKERCYSIVAIAKQDTNACNSIEEDNIWIDCLWGIAARSKNPNLCDELPNGDWRTYLCYSKIAIATQDLRICDRMEERGLTFPEESPKYICYIDVAIDTYNLEICNMIDDQKFKDSCYFSIAIRKNDKSICDNIINQEIKSECYISAEE